MTEILPNFENNPLIFTIIYLVLVIAIGFGLTRFMGAKSTAVIVLMTAFIFIYFYAMDIMTLPFASIGFLTFAIMSYFIFNTKGGSLR